MLCRKNCVIIQQAHLRRWADFLFSCLSVLICVITPAARRRQPRALSLLFSSFVRRCRCDRADRFRISRGREGSRLGVLPTQRATQEHNTHIAPHTERVHSVETILPGFGKCWLKMLRHSAILGWAAEHFEGDS